MRGELQPRKEIKKDIPQISFEEALISPKGWLASVVRSNLDEAIEEAKSWVVSRREAPKLILAGLTARLSRDADKVNELYADIG